MTTTRLRAAAVLLVGTVAAGVLVPAAVAAGASGGVRVTINGDPGPYLEHDRDLLGPGAIDQPQVTTTQRINGQNSYILAGGTTAKNLVLLASVNPDSLLDVNDAMTVTYAGRSGSVALSADEVRHGFSGDPRGTYFATFDAEYNASEVLFFRPLRDPNSDTASVDPPGHTDVLVNLRTSGSRLSVHLTPSASQIDPGESVSFTTAPAPAGATYKWDFEGDEQQVTNHQASDAHVYRARGTYQARVTVTTPNGSSGTDAVVIQVGKPAPGGGSGGPSTSSAALTGGGRGGGGKGRNGGGNADRKAPNSGPARGRRTDSTTQRRSPNARAGTRGAGGAGPQRGDRSRPSRTANGDAHRRSRRASPPARGPGVRVRGVLLADQTAFKGTLPATRSPAAAFQRSAARAGGGTPSGLLGWLVGVALCLVVLLGGATQELRLLGRHALGSA